MTRINGREMTIEALATWLEGLPDDFAFSRPNTRYTCDCLVGRYLNNEGERKYSVGYGSVLDIETDKTILADMSEMAQMVHLFDRIEEDNITAAEVRKRIVAYIFFGCD